MHTARSRTSERATMSSEGGALALTGSAEKKAQGIEASHAAKKRRLADPDAVFNPRKRIQAASGCNSQSAGSLVAENTENMTAYRKPSPTAVGRQARKGSEEAPELEVVTQLGMCLRSRQLYTLVIPQIAKQVEQWENLISRCDALRTKQRALEERRDRARARAEAFDQWLDDFVAAYP